MASIEFTTKGQIPLVSCGEVFLDAFCEYMERRFNSDDEGRELWEMCGKPALLIPTLMVGLDEFAKDMGYTPIEFYEMMCEVCRATDKEDEE